MDELTDHDWLQIEQAANGCISGTSDEWPDLTAAIAKVRGKPMTFRKSAAWLQGFCEAMMEWKASASTDEGTKPSSYVADAICSLAVNVLDNIHEDPRKIIAAILLLIDEICIEGEFEQQFNDWRDKVSSSWCEISGGHQ